MLALFKIALSWLTGGTLDRILSSVDHRVDNETARENIKADLVHEYLKAQVAVSNGRQWWFPILFLVPAGFWFGAVCVYSVLWCKGCAYPQDWIIAALPAPLDEWMAAIIGSLFIGKAGEMLIRNLRK